MIINNYNGSPLVFPLEGEMRYEREAVNWAHAHSLLRFRMCLIEAVYLIRNRVLGTQQNPRNNLREEQRNANKVISKLEA